jgi:hypothetical protein
MGGMMARVRGGILGNFCWDSDFAERSDRVPKKGEFAMKGFAVVLMGALLCVGSEGLAQMGAPDGRPTPSLPGVAGPLAAKYGADAAKILQASETDGDGYAALTYLCDHVGKRLSGTPQLNTAIEWGAELMRKAGLENVKVQPVMVPKSRGR